MNLEILQGNLKKWLEHNFPETTSDMQFKGVVEEVGELARADLKTEQGIRGFTAVKGRLKAMDAVGDIVIYLINYCNMKDYSFIDCINMAWAEVSKRDWIAHPEGPVDNEFIESTGMEAIAADSVSADECNKIIANIESLKKAGEVSFEEMLHIVSTDFAVTEHFVRKMYNSTGGCFVD